MGWGVMDYPGEPQEHPPVLCPVCGWEASKIYADRNGEVLGCDNCIESYDADEWEAEQVV